MAQREVSMQTKLAAVLAREAAIDRGGLDVTAVCARLGISRTTYYKYRQRFETEGVDGLLARSRRPHTSPGRLSSASEDAVVRAHKQLDADGWDCGAISIHARLLAEAGPDSSPVPSLRSIHRILHRRGLVEPQPAKRTRASYRRFEFPATDDCWQIDAFEHALADGRTVVVFEVLDDHSRFLVANLAWPSEDGAGAWSAVAGAISAYGQPRMLLSDNSLAFSGARRHRRVQFETNLQALGIKPITSRPYKPTTCGKNERHHQTCQRWLRRQPPTDSPQSLQAQLDRYRELYNTGRPHQGIGMSTPAARREAGRRPLPATAEPADTRTTVTVTVTEHTVNARGQIRLHGTGIGLGSQWAGTRVTTFRAADHLLVFHRDELVRELTIDPTRSFHPTGQPRGGPRRTRIADTIR